MADHLACNLADERVARSAEMMVDWSVDKMVNQLERRKVDWRAAATVLPMAASSGKLSAALMAG